METGGHWEIHGINLAHILSILAVVSFVGGFMVVYGSSDSGAQNQPIALDPIPHQQGDELTAITFTASASGGVVG